MNNDYKIILPKNFTNAHKKYLEKFKSHVSTASEFGFMLGAKDINSKHIIATNAYANIVGLKYGNDVEARFDKDMPCEGTAQYAENYVKEDLSLINSLDINKNISILNIHNYNDGLKARIFKKRLLFHKDSQSILGTIYSGHDVELKNIFNLIPKLLFKFNSNSIIIKNKKHLEKTTLTEYEQEICFLLLLNWSFKQVATFMNEHRPDKFQRSADTIIKKKNYICEKLNLRSTHINYLQDFLVSAGFHNYIPESIYNIIRGSIIL